MPITPFEIMMAKIWSMGLVVLVVWEVRFRRYPERFWFGSNKLLQCAHCPEQLCRYKYPRSPRFRKPM